MPHELSPERWDRISVFEEIVSSENFSVLVFEGLYTHFFSIFTVTPYSEICPPFILMRKLRLR